MINFAKPFVAPENRECIQTVPSHSFDTINKEKTNPLENLATRVLAKLHLYGGVKASAVLCEWPRCIITSPEHRHRLALDIAAVKKKLGSAEAVKGLRDEKDRRVKESKTMQSHKSESRLSESSTDESMD
ncbi:hypothetical protein WR25_03178 [Diploscapter pachys]|uniref:Uncharacterized protein n=1 Tax=Diploscapter pachys TaxID=2018661 RepID=A0A2A2L7Z0_9BILA|nr:hypothetical protein WR25_03178 [Diploscapter pachys]